jgi:hypothetical protein
LSKACHSDSDGQQLSPGACRNVSMEEDAIGLTFPAYTFTLWGGSGSEFSSANKWSAPSRGQHGQQRDNESETHLYRAFFLVRLRGKRNDLVLDRENDADEWLSPTFNLCRTLLCPVRYFGSRWGDSLDPVQHRVQWRKWEKSLIIDSRLWLSA